MKLEIRNLQTQIERLKKQNIDLKCKAKISKVTGIYKNRPNI